jgi:hypothetical protein
MSFASFVNSTNKKRGAGAPLRSASAATTAAQNKQCDDNQPDPVVIEEIAKTVAVHGETSTQNISRWRLPSALLFYVASPQMFPQTVKKSGAAHFIALCHTFFHKNAGPLREKWPCFSEIFAIMLDNTRLS